jgi:hypothetical protein
MCSRTISASGFSFAVCGTVAVLTAVEALHYLELWDESLWLVVKIVDVTSISNTFVCCMIVVEVDHYRTVFHFDGGFFVFASEKGNFGDGSAWKVVGGFE